MTVLAPASHTYFSQRLRLHYVDWGNVRAPTLLMVHGIHDHCRTWDDVVPGLADRYHIVAPDLRGHGDSEWIKGSSYGYLDYIYDLHQLVQQAQLAPLTLVGHSMGGAIAAMFAGVYPQLVERLVIIEGIGNWSAFQPELPVHEKISDWVSATQQLAGRLPRRYVDLDEALHRMQQANPQLSDEQALHLTVHGSNQNEDGSFSWKYDNYTHNFSSQSISKQDTEALWRNITAPTLVINAEHGLQHRIGQDDSLAHFNNATLLNIAGAGHWTYHDQRVVVEKSINNFLA